MAEEIVGENETVEEYFDEELEKKMIHYEYQSRMDGLFACEAESLAEARKKKDAWQLKFLGFY